MPRSTRRGRPPRYVCVDVIREMHYQGISFRAIAKATGVGYGTVRRAFTGHAPVGADLSVRPRPANTDSEPAALAAAADSAKSELSPQPPDPTERSLTAN